MERPGLPRSLVIGFLEQAALGWKVETARFSKSIDQAVTEPRFKGKGWRPIPQQEDCQGSLRSCYVSGTVLDTAHMASFHPPNNSTTVCFQHCLEEAT